MAKLQFTKVHGTGNDFIIYTDVAGQRPLTPEQIAALCDRHFGIGADGVIRAVKTVNLPDGAELAAAVPEAEWFMDYYNSDGSIAEMCGNGVRAYVHYLLTEGLLSTADRRDTLPIATRAGVKDVLIGVAGYSVDIGRWSLRPEVDVTAYGTQVARPSLGIDVGNPHQIVALPSEADLAELDLTRRPTLEPELPAGANIEFVTPDPQLLKDGVAHIHMRVYERGVGETLSCGTGVVAAALAFRHWGGKDMPNTWKVTVPGGTLGVRMFPTEEGEHVSLSGPAQVVFKGEIEI